VPAVFLPFVAGYDIKIFFNSRVWSLYYFSFWIFCSAVDPLPSHSSSITTTSPHFMNPFSSGYKRWIHPSIHFSMWVTTWAISPPHLAPSCMEELSLQTHSPLLSKDTNPLPTPFLFSHSNARISTNFGSRSKEKSSPEYLWTPSSLF